MGLTQLPACSICKTSKFPFLPKAPTTLAQFHLPFLPPSTPLWLRFISEIFYLYRNKIARIAPCRTSHSPTPRAPGMTRSRSRSPALPSLQSCFITASRLPLASLIMLLFGSFVSIPIDHPCFQASSPRAPGGVTGVSSNEQLLVAASWLLPGHRNWFRCQNPAPAGTMKEEIQGNRSRHTPGLNWDVQRLGCPSGV